MKLANMKIGARLSLGFWLILIMIGIMASISLYSMSRIQENFEFNVQVIDVKVDAMHDLRQILMEAIVTGRNLTLLTESEAIDRENRKLAAARKEYVRLFDKLSLIVTAEEKTFLGQINIARQAAIDAQIKVTGLSQGIDKSAAIRMMISDVQPLQNKSLDAMEDLIELIKKNAEQATEDARNSLHAARLAIYVISALVVFMGCGIGWLVTRSIVIPLAETVSVVRRVAKHDLSGKITLRSNDETGILMAAMQEMTAHLAGTISQVRSGTDIIVTASTQLAVGNSELSNRTEEQASALEETASTMEQLTTTVKLNADNAQQARLKASMASEVAHKGGTLVGQVVETMNAINASSNKIVDIISVIDGIAFQTNILALNAAVEAARAGEQGRGFAVVANEVRNLAQRSAVAAREIKALIGDSVNQVATGSDLVRQAGHTMAEIVASIQEVSDIVTEITTASNEQSNGIQQVNRAIIQIDDVTQQNAALVEQAAAAAESMQEQARVLLQIVSVFKLEEQPTAAAPAEPLPKPAFAGNPVRRAIQAPPPIAGARIRMHRKARGLELVKN